MLGSKALPVIFAMNQHPCLSALCLSVLLAASAFGQNRTFTSQFSFGDSLSDSGNLFAATRGAQPPPPYFNGRFSNGPTFVELLGNPLVPAATLSSFGTNRNYAFGGATAGPGSPVPSLGQQIGMYQLQVQGRPTQATDLFTVLAGANDLIGVLSAPTTPANPASLDAAGAATAQAAAAGVQALVGLGARNIVVAGLPNLGATPRSLAAGGPGGPGATFGLRASAAYNTALRSQLATIAASAPDVNLVYVDLQGIIDRIALDYQKIGFANATSYSLAPAAQGGGAGDPNSYVFWDDIHPTARTHALLAAIVLEELNPEPVLGFAATTGTAALALQSLGARALDARLSQVAATQRAVGRADVFATFNYVDGARAADGWQPKLNYSGEILATGADLRVSDGFIAGGAIGVGRLDADVRGGRGDFKVEDTTGRLYGLWRGEPVTLALDVDYGVVRVKDIRRTTAFGGLPAHAKTSGTHWGAGLKALWSIDAGGFAVRPWFGVRTGRVKLDAYTERDVPSLAMAVAAQTVKSSSAAVGVDAGRDWKLGTRAARLDFRAAWRGEIGNQARTVSGRLADNFTLPAGIALDDGDGDGVELGGAATVFFAQNWSATLGYAGDIRSGEKLGSRVTFSLQTGF